METRKKVEKLVSEDKKVVLLSQNIEDVINQRIVVLQGKRYSKQDGRLRKIVDDQKVRSQLNRSCSFGGTRGNQ